jgi:hypothetical protein
VRSAKILIPAASRRGITEFSLRAALPLNPSLRSKERGIGPQRFNSYLTDNLTNLETHSFSWKKSPALNLDEVYSKISNID